MENLDYSTPRFEKPKDDYLRVMTASPDVAVADPAINTQQILAYYQEATDKQVELLALPELSVTGYTTADLFFNRHVLEQTQKALGDLADATVGGPAMVVGAPLEHQGLLYNCGVVLAEGKVAGVVPKSFLPNYNEFYEQRWFASGRTITDDVIRVNDQAVPFGTDLLFDINGTKVGIEICEDMFAPIPPSAGHALAGAEVIVNLSASDELVGKDEYRRRLVAGHAGSFICAYVYTSAGPSESNADVVYGGHQMVNELGKMMGETKPLSADGNTVVDIDRTYISHDRLVNTTFRDQATDYRQTKTYRTVAVAAPKPTDNELYRRLEPQTYQARSKEALDERCEYIFNIMAHGLAGANHKTTKGMIIGLSGGLDSTLALLTATYTANLMGQPHDFIHTITMPGMASSERTQDNASRLAEALGTHHTVMPISELANEALETIGHDRLTEDVTYENTQARMRTLLLMNYANKIHGLVVGTGDLSETAQGWCTFNGDHMSMYNPNVGVPKTLVRHLVQWFADNLADEPTQKILHDILDTPVSPELTGNGDLSQTTESIIGPYTLHDFFMNEMQRYGSRPEKIGYLATKTYQGIFTEDEVATWLASYLKRFTASQWKRESVPNGTKIGTVALSPRGDWRMAPNTSQNWYNS